MTPEQVRNLRTRLCLTQAEMAQVMGISAQTIMRWEMGKATPRRLYERALLKLADKEPGSIFPNLPHYELPKMRSKTNPCNVCGRAEHETPRYRNRHPETKGLFDTNLENRDSHIALERIGQFSLPNILSRKLSLIPPPGDPDDLIVEYGPNTLEPVHAS